jgi:hypothetical protein
MANKRAIGSLCLTDLNEAAKKGHSAFSRSSKNGKIYCNVTMWINAETDKNGNDFSIQLSSKKDMDEADKAKFDGKKVYAGNLKHPASYEEKPVTEAEDKFFIMFYYLT